MKMRVSQVSLLCYRIHTDLEPVPCDFFALSVAYLGGGPSAQTAGSPMIRRSSFFGGVALTGFAEAEALAVGGAGGVTAVDAEAEAVGTGGHVLHGGVT